ncbi:MAG: glutamate decarboxylase [Spirochaetales bacterium]
MLYNKNDVRFNTKDEMYGSSDAEKILPKFKLPQHEMDPRHAYEGIHNELMLDGNASQNLATFVQTWEEKEVHHLMDECIVKNMIDKSEYPQTAALEERCVHMLAHLWNSPEADSTLGTSTTGSSEAAMLGGLAMLHNWRKKRKAEGKPCDKPNMVCGAVQICWHKFARYWDVEIREVPLEKDKYVMQSADVLQYVDENTICVVPTYGLTLTLHYENVLEISRGLDKLQEEKGLDIPIHVDGASGAFLAPFIDEQKDAVWDFRIPRVKSINASGHKFGLAPVGVGWIVWRDASCLPEELIFYVNYLGGNMPTFALNFSRPGGQIVAQYYNFIRLGYEGYRKIQTTSSKTGQWFSKEIAKLGIFTMVYDGHGGIPGSVWRLKDDANVNFTLYDLADRLQTRGWLVPAYSLPKNITDVVVQRILVKQNFSRDMAGLLVDDIQRAVEHFKKHPVSNPLTEKEASSFKHN